MGPLGVIECHAQVAAAQRPRLPAGFFDFPAEHWEHIRTTNPIESVFATVRHRIGKTKVCLSRTTRLAIAFKLVMSTQREWQKPNEANLLPEIVKGVVFVDGIKQIQATA